MWSFIWLVKESSSVLFEVAKNKETLSFNLEHQQPPNQSVGSVELRGMLYKHWGFDFQVLIGVFLENDDPSSYTFKIIRLQGWMTMNWRHPFVNTNFFTICYSIACEANDKPQTILTMQKTKSRNVICVDERWYSIQLVASSWKNS